MIEIQIKHSYEISQHIPLSKVAYALALYRTTLDGKHEYHKSTYKNHLSLVATILEDEIKNGSLKAFEELEVMGVGNFIDGKASPLEALNRWGQGIGYKFLVIDDLLLKATDENGNISYRNGVFIDQSPNATEEQKVRQGKLIKDIENKINPVKIDNKIRGLKKQTILSVDWPLSDKKFQKTSLERALGDVPGWLKPARVYTAPPGKGISSLWNPALIASCLLSSKKSKKTALTNLIKMNFPEWLVEWESIVENYQN